MYISYREVYAMERNQSGKEEIVSINEMVREGSLARRHWRKDGKKVRERATWAQGEEQQDRDLPGEVWSGGTCFTGQFEC